MPHTTGLCWAGMRGRRAQALVSVATRFLVDIPDIQADVRDSLSLHMAFAHLAVADASQR